MTHVPQTYPQRGDLGSFGKQEKPKASKLFTPGEHIGSEPRPAHHHLISNLQTPCTCGVPEIVSESLEFALRHYYPCIAAWVYFVRCSASGKIKIGFSREPRRRLRTLSTGSPLGMSLIGALPGYLEVERHVQEALSGSRIRLEWLEETAEVRDFLRELGICVARAFGERLGSILGDRDRWDHWRTWADLWPEPFTLLPEGSPATQAAKLLLANRPGPRFRKQRSEADTVKAFSKWISHAPASANSLPAWRCV